MNNFVIERSPKREGINKGNAIAYQYDQLACNPMGDSQLHHEIKTEMANEGLKKRPIIGSGLSFLHKEQNINGFEANLKERDRYVICGTYRKDVDKTVARGQASLVLAGYDLGEYGYKGVDGVNGRLTRKAVSEFQKDVGLKPTGEFDQDTMKALDLVAATGLTKAAIEAIGRKVMQAQEMAKPVAPKQPAIQPLSLEELTPEAKQRLAERDVKVNQVDFRKTGGNYQYAQAEASLELLGYKNSNPIDGKPDQQSIENLKQFQKDTGLPVTGRLDPDTYHMMEQKMAEGWKRPGLEKNSSEQELGVKSDAYRETRQINVIKKEYQMETSGEKLRIYNGNKQFSYDLKEMKDDFHKLAELQDKKDKTAEKFAAELRLKYQEFLNAFNDNKDTAKIIAIRKWGEGKASDTFQRLGEQPYDDMFVVIDRKGNINIFNEVNLEGSTAKGYVNIRKQKTYIDGENPTIKDGVYSLNTVIHSGYDALTLNDNGRVPTQGTNPNFRERDKDPNGPYAEGVHIHKGGDDWNWSEGCLTIHQSEWDRFIALFPTDQGSAEVGKIALISI